MIIQSAIPALSFRSRRLGLVATFAMVFALLAATQSPATPPASVLLKPIPDRLVVLTFDDACASHATFVGPLLKKHGFGATFFICEYPGFELDKKAYMTWEQIASLDKMGFELANHTRTHKHVDRQKKEQLIAELEYIEKQFTERNVAKPVSFAYPAYATHPTAFAVLEERGYHFARIGGSRPYLPQKDSPLLIPSFSTSGNNKDRVLAALAQAKDAQVVVLTIHGVPDIAHPHVSTSPELFEQIVQFLADNRYTVIALRDLARYVDPNIARRAIPATQPVKPPAR